MKTKRFATTVSLGVLVLILALLGVQTATWGQAMPAAVAASPVGTAFTYQGQLQSGGAPVDDTCDFSFSLWDAASTGNQIGSSQPALNTPVIGGLFAVELDFGDNAFRGEARWLQTAVRCPAGGGEYTTLAPRQALNPVPYAIQSQDLRLPFWGMIDSPDPTFRVQNSGAGSAISTFTDGTGDAIITNAIIGNAIAARTEGSGDALHADAFGSGAAIEAWAHGSGRTIDAYTAGTNDLMSLGITNPDNSALVINARTEGLGGGANFRIENPLNDMPALQAETNGSGRAAYFTSSGSGEAIAVWSFGSGTLATLRNEGTGRGVDISIANPDNTANVIEASTNGLGGGGSFMIENPLNDTSALLAETYGSGAAISGRAYGSGEAIRGRSWSSGWTANFYNEGSGNGVFISSAEGTTGLSVVGGSKNAVVPTSEGARLLYTEESSEVWFTDYGFGRLAGGSVFIAIDTLFAETVNLEEPYHVFVQAYGDAELYVSQRTPEGFEVRLRAGDPAGDPEVEFSYRLVATRRGYEGQRLEPAAWADDDPNLNHAQPAAPENGGAE